MGFGNDRCDHPAWSATPNRDLERCIRCGVLRHKAFVPSGGGQARTVTGTRTRTTKRAA